jgi:hypothetical protein
MASSSLWEHIAAVMDGLAIARARWLYYFRGNSITGRM